MISTRSTIFAVVTVAGCAFAGLASAAPLTGATSERIVARADVAQPVHYRKRWHCHWRGKHRRCHGGKYRYRGYYGPSYGYRRYDGPGIYLHFGDRDRRYRRHHRGRH